MRGWEEARALLGERVSQRVGGLCPPEPTTESHFLTKTCLAHSHSPSLFAPPESPCKRQNGLGLTRVRSSICFPAPFVSASGFVRPGSGGEEGLAGPFPQPGCPSLIRQPRRDQQCRDRSQEGTAATCANTARRERSWERECTGSSPVPGFRPPDSAPSPCQPQRAAGRPTGARPAGRFRGRELQTWGCGGHSRSWALRAGPMSVPRGGLGSPRAR